MVDKYKIMERIMNVCERCTGAFIWIVLISASLFLWYLIYILVTN
jgi:hypothetical protein